MIELKSLNVEAGNFRLQDITFIIESGSRHVIVGPTGSGKTLLLETILGLRRLISGTILIDGKDITNLSPNNRNIAYVPQDVCLFPTLTVYQNIRFGLDVRKIEAADSQEFINRLVEFLHISDLLGRYPLNLSGGEKQRVALARALATKPALLILDEPFSAIDHSLREEIRRMLKELLDEFKTTTLIVTHDLDEAFFLGDKVSIILNGRIIQSGTREEIYYFPKTIAAAEFLGIKNIFSGTIESIYQDKISLSSVELNRNVVVPCHCAHKRFSPKQLVRFGIHSEAVKILRHNDVPQDGQNIFDAKVRKLFVRGRMHTVIVELQTPKPVLVEIDIHDAAARKIGIERTRELQIDLNSKSIFLLS